MEYKTETEFIMYPDNNKEKDQMRKEHLKNVIRLHESRLQFWTNVRKYTKKRHLKEKAKRNISVFEYTLNECKKLEG